MWQFNFQFGIKEVILYLWMQYKHTVEPLRKKKGLKTPNITASQICFKKTTEPRKWGSKLIWFTLLGSKVLLLGFCLKWILQSSRSPDKRPSKNIQSKCSPSTPPPQKKKKGVYLWQGFIHGIKCKVKWTDSGKKQSQKRCAYMWGIYPCQKEEGV